MLYLRYFLVDPCPIVRACVCVLIDVCVQRLLFLFRDQKNMYHNTVKAKLPPNLRHLSWTANSKWRLVRSSSLANTHLMRFTRCNFTDADTRLPYLPAVFSAFPPYTIQLRRLKMNFFLEFYGFPGCPGIGKDRRSSFVGLNDQWGWRVRRLVWMRPRHFIQRHVGVCGNGSLVSSLYRQCIYFTEKCMLRNR